ncbi:MAG: diphthine synthase [Methanocalculus sp. MSAO_Arc1]|uniref:diphthine synthase n=1 Tax=Methanocalculus TaxID=71151 RepID=UPI000FF77744|nr:MULTISPECIES: diphthine synthase [unclassified Methanocalculus]MCP1662308.1 diphthine synthase [Methanocalculus sp. AMF5]RQD80930.1 MAG: diphthine synthase [Methanocalculus sp. MSAO_Arc1]
MLTFIGLGLFDETDISLKGLSAIQAADALFLETYTSRLMGSDPAVMEQLYGKPITLLSREDVEQHPDTILDAAEKGLAVFLTAGDTMVSTTHADLRIRAAERGIQTRIIHAASIASAVCGLSGLQNYRFGKSCSLPFPHGKWMPTTPVEVILDNLSRNLHTIVYLDIQDTRYMLIPDAIPIIEEIISRMGRSIPLYVGIARAGSDDMAIHAGSGADLLSHEFGPPLHILLVPAELHHMEREYLETFAGLPQVRGQQP